VTQAHRAARKRVRERGLVLLTSRMQLTTSRNAVGAVFAINGLLYASLLSRVPDVREGLAIDNATLGLLLLAIAAGSLVGLPTAGRLVEWRGAAAVVRAGAVLSACGLAGAGASAGAAGSVAGTAASLVVYGVGTGVWDVAMNVEGAEVERRLRRTVMPRFHAGWSLGSVAGAGCGVFATAADVPMVVHLGLLSLACLGATAAVVSRFLVVEPSAAVANGPSGRSTWTEPRTLLIGAMVMTFALAEGTANDWLSLAVIDGHDAPRWVGVAALTLFVASMTAGRMVGPVFLDRHGRVPVLWTAAGGVAGGALLTVAGGHPALVAAGVVAWGLGASLGFPVGMSAAADDPYRAAARVSVVATIGYGAFLGGPPLVGYLADRVGTLDSLLVVVVMMVPAVLTATAARPSGRDRARGPV
jgi:MFS family permease